MDDKEMEGGRQNKKSMYEGGRGEETEKSV